MLCAACTVCCVHCVLRALCAACTVCCVHCVLRALCAAWCGCKVDWTLCSLHALHSLWAFAVGSLRTIALCSTIKRIVDEELERWMMRRKRTQLSKSAEGSVLLEGVFACSCIVR